MYTAKIERREREREKNNLKFQSVGNNCVFCAYSSSFLTFKKTPQRIALCLPIENRNAIARIDEQRVHNTLFFINKRMNEEMALRFSFHIIQLVKFLLILFIFFFLSNIHRVQLYQQRTFYG